MPTEDEHITSKQHIELNVLSGDDAQQRRRPDGEAQALDGSAEHGFRSVSAMHTVLSLACVIAPARAQQHFYDTGQISEPWAVLPSH